MAAATSSSFPPLPSTAATTTVLLSDSDTDASSISDTDDPTTTTTLESSILSSYLSHSTSSVDLSKIRSFLTSSSSSSIVHCLICLERIRPSHPTWSCSLSCHQLFHLPCIQSWAHQSIHSTHSRTPTPTSLLPWHCPKCRFPYPSHQIPKTYLCFCGKLQDPPPDPWLLPHSCGEPCRKPLSSSCPHPCLLLCHPGPCPPCPVSVPYPCFCGRSRPVRRCAFREFSCGKPCAKPAPPCGLHPCPEPCHPGPCPPCRVLGWFRCECGEAEEERECCEGTFQCGKAACGGTLVCGKHPCARGCHAGPCGDCPLQGRRTCPCGKRAYEGVPCDAAVPNCGATCEKPLGCGVHWCPERCHRGPCAEICRRIVSKSCRCGSLKKEVPCHQQLVCERKCQRLRDCGRHACKRRCCPGDCPPCPEICGRKLRCNNHKCPSPCHRGACSPCPLMVSISCFCGETKFEVPCGMEKGQKPPKCPKACQIPRLCRHRFESRKHKCHYGACPPCRKICNEELPCGHMCKERCHGPTPAANPEFTLKQKKRRPEKQTEGTLGSPCPPCQEIILRPCLGQHVGEEKSMLCSDKRRFSCQNLCGNLLRCGNHYCTKPCHALKNADLDMDRSEEKIETLAQLDIDNKDLAKLCEDCFLPCQKERKPVCPHPCPSPCHPNDCPPCKALIKRACHCGSMVHVFECIHYNSMSNQEQLMARSCGGPCHRKLPSCPHLCSEICHPGACPSAEKCGKKVIVRCACHSVKKEWVCMDVHKAYLTNGRDPKDAKKNQYGVGILPCNQECMSKHKVDDSEIVHRKTKVIESKVKEDVESVRKRRKKRERVKCAQEASKYQVFKEIVWKCFLFLSIAILLFGSIYYGYKGIYRLSDWMYEIENRRTRKGIPRI